MSGNNTLGVDSSDKLVYNGAVVQTGTGFVTSITGTSNQVIASAATGAVTLSLPQNIGTASSVIFGSELINGPLSLSPASGNPRIVFDTTSGGVITFDVPSTASTTFSLHLPNAQGAANSILTNDGSGNLSWATGSGVFVSSITGTTNQVIASASTGAVTLSLPQNIATTSTPTFGGETITASGTNDAKIGINNAGGTVGLGVIHQSGNDFGVLNLTGGLSTATSANIYTLAGGAGLLTIQNTVGNVRLLGSAAGVSVSALSAENGTSSFIGNSTTPFGNIFTKAALIFQQSGVGTNAINLAAAAAVTSYALTLPPAQGSANQTWINDGSGNLSFATLPVAGGGSGNTTFTAYSVICAGTTATGAFQNVSGLGSSGQVLTSNGPGLLPTWQTLAGTGTVNSGTSTHLAYYATSTNAVSDAASATISGAYTFSGGAGAITMSSSTIAMGANKITGLANGTASTDAAAFGQIPVFAAAVQSTLTTPFTTTLSTYQSTGLAASIIPTTSSRRVKITFSGTMSTASGTAAAAIITLKRGSTDLATNGSGFAQLKVNSAVLNQAPVSFTFIDSPATASSVTYTIFIRNDDAATTVSTPIANGQDQLIVEDIV